MALNQPVYISGAGQYQVTSTASTGANGTSVQLKNLGTSGNAVPGSVISAGNIISPSGIQGNNAYSITSATFSWTTFGTSSTITCNTPGNTVAWMQPNQIVYVAGAGYFQVNGSPNVTNGMASLTLLNYAGNTQNGSVASGAGVSPGGTEGSLPLPSPPTPFAATGLSMALTSGTMSNIDSALITLPSGGSTWLIFGRLVLKQGTTNQATTQPGVQAQLQAQVSGAGLFSPVANSTSSLYFNEAGSSNIVGGGVLPLPPVVYVQGPTSTGDVIGLYAASLTTGNATVNVTEVYLAAVCISLAS